MLPVAKTKGPVPIGVTQSPSGPTDFGLITAAAPQSVRCQRVREQRHRFGKLHHHRSVIRRTDVGNLESGRAVEFT